MESEKKNYSWKPFSEMEIDELEKSIQKMEDTLANPGKEGVWDDTVLAGLKDKLQEAREELATKTLTNF